MAQRRLAPDVEASPEENYPASEVRAPHDEPAARSETVSVSGKNMEIVAPPPHSYDTQRYQHLVGMTLLGRYRVDGVIGVGSMGVVLSGTHLELDEPVAVKLIRSEMQQLHDVVARFAREAKAMAGLRSEHIAQVLDVGTEDGVGHFIVMERLEGQDLGELLHADGRLSIRRAVHYAMQACAALAVAHQRGITHRDIKPENLYLTKQGDRELIKLLDFGISKAAVGGRLFGRELNEADEDCLLGTPLYMSPEQIRGTDKVDARSDIWSLGAVLYELLTGSSAFVAESVSEVWGKILEAEHEPVASHRPEVPPSLAAVVDCCLEKDPGRRFDDVAQLALALLPFGPARARPFAQRACDVLGCAESVPPVPSSRQSGGRTSGPHSAQSLSFAGHSLLAAIEHSPPLSAAAERTPRTALLALFASASLTLAVGAAAHWLRQPQEPPPPPPLPRLAPPASPLVLQPDPETRPRAPSPTRARRGLDRPPLELRDTKALPTPIDVQEGPPARPARRRKKRRRR